MAHVGRNYKLHLRRDLCVGIRDHKNSWPECWRVGGILVPHLGPNNPQIRINALAPPSDPEDKDALRWQTDWITSWDKPFYIKLFYKEHDYTTNQAVITFEIWDDTHKTAHKDAKMLLPEQCNNIDVGFGTSQNLIIDDPEWWGTSTVQTALSGVAARWDEWPL